MLPLKVLQFICPAGMYGAEMWILALAKSLDPAKVDCRLAVTRESESQNLEVFHRYRALGLRAYRAPMRGRFDPSAVYGLYRLLKREGIDIVHSHGYKSDLLGLAAARMAGVKALATPHGFENVKDLKLQWFIRMGCAALKHFDAVAPLSEELSRDMAKLGVPPGRVRLVRNGVDVEEIDGERLPMGRGTVEDGPRKIGYIGQMAFRKNVGDLLAAFDRFYEAHDNCRLVLVGDGPMRQDLQEKASGLPSASAIRFLGYRRDRLKLLREMSLFSMTSSLEGIPRCMMEAMAMGVPVAAYDIPGVDKLVLHEETGLLAPFGDVESLKACWERLLFDEELASRLARNARSRILEHFSAARMAQEYTELYEKMLI